MARKDFARHGIIAAWLCLALVGQGQAALPVFEQPAWQGLTTEQKQVLQPLRNEWDAMDAFRRKKWLGIAERYREMTPAEQESIQRNMREWARLAPEERKTAREQYKKLRRVAPEQRQVVKQKWEEYSALPAETRKHMKDIAPKRPQLKTPARQATAVPAPSATLVSPAATVKRSPLSPIKPPQSALAPNSPPRPAPKSVPQSPATTEE